MFLLKEYMKAVLLILQVKVVQVKTVHATLSQHSSVCLPRLVSTDDAIQPDSTAAKELQQQGSCLHTFFSTQPKENSAAHFWHDHQ